jgi:hypothetical protein
LIKRFASAGQTECAMGVAWAPTAFWANQKWDGDEEDNDKIIEKKHHDIKDVILIGNFGDGRYQRYGPGR